MKPSMPSIVSSFAPVSRSKAVATALAASALSLMAFAWSVHPAQALYRSSISPIRSTPRSPRPSTSTTRVPSSIRQRDRLQRLPARPPEHFHPPNFRVQTSGTQVTGIDAGGDRSGIVHQSRRDHPRLLQARRRRVPNCQSADLGLQPVARDHKRQRDCQVFVIHRCDGGDRPEGVPLVGPPTPMSTGCFVERQQPGDRVNNPETLSASTCRPRQPRPGSSTRMGRSPRSTHSARPSPRRSASTIMGRSSIETDANGVQHGYVDTTRLLDLRPAEFGQHHDQRRQRSRHRRLLYQQRDGYRHRLCRHPGARAASLLLLASGLFSLGAIRRRRKAG